MLATTATATGSMPLLPSTLVAPSATSADTIARPAVTAAAISTPPSPTGLVAVPGDARVNLTWSAPASNGGAAISDYVVQVSSNNGATWSTFADGVSTATATTVTGLTNGTSYVFRVAAVNAAGTGAASVASATILPRTMTTLPGYGVATSAVFYFSGGGWAGWSVPAGKVVLGAKIISPGDSIADFAVFKAAGPDEVFPHYSYGPAEYGWVMQAKQPNEGVQIEVYYADPPTIDVQVSPAIVAEDSKQELIYTFTASAVTATPITVKYHQLTSDRPATEGVDFTGLPPGTGVRSITIPANATTAAVTVRPTPDLAIEPDETVDLALLQGTGYSFGSKTVATGTIENDDFVVDLDVDSDNSGSIARSLFEDSIEDDPTRPGVLVPVGGGQAQMIVDVPAGRTATLAFDAAAASKVRVVSPSGAVVLDAARLSTTVSGGSPQTFSIEAFSIEAFAPSTSPADIVFTLTTTGTGPASSDVVRATAVAVDLDVDSDNDGLIDPDNGPGGTDDVIEADVSRGLVLPVYAGDSDRDGIVDTEDFNGIAGRSFMPLTLSINYGAASAWRQPIRSLNAPNEDVPGLAFTFTFSDAGLGPNPAGRFRIWTKDARFARTPQDLVTSGTAITAWDLFRAAPPAADSELIQTHGIFTLYLEAVSTSDVFEPLTVSMGGTGAWARAVTKDLVHVRGLQAAIDLDVDSNNDEGFAVPAQRSAWEERLESHPYAIGKLVVQSSPDLDDYVAEDRLAAHFTPVVVELPRNLPLESRGIAQTIGIRFTMDAIGAMDGGKIRLWTRDKGLGLLLQDAAGEPSPLGGWRVFGHRVDFDKPYTLSQINYDPATGKAILYMDGHVATRNVKLVSAEQGPLDRGDLKASLTFNASNARISLAEGSVQYMVVRDDFFYHDLQFGSVGLGSTGSQVRSALASRGVYSYADLPNFALKRLTTRKDPDSPPGELQEILELDPNSDAVALLYNDADKPGNPTAYPGFKAVLYQDYAAVADNTFVLAFGGTDDQLGLAFNGEMPELADWVENIGQGLGWRIAQYRWAMQVARAVDAAVRRNPGGGALTTTGHSLGGGLASAASVVTGATGVTFNAAGLHENSLRMYFENDPAELAVALARYQNPQGLVTAYTVDWDFLSNFQDRLRLVVNPALGDCNELDGPHDFATETIQAIDAAFSAAGAVPGGALVKLGINLAAKAGTGYLMYRCHSMDVVLYGLLVKENLINDNRDLLGYPLSRFF